ncbi:hypothetical protein OH82_04666 [Azospirillum brasilense]|nr:hypothetical protein OH82_04666 [Azospirillum brasilense]
MGGVHLDHQAFDDLQRQAVQIRVFAIWVAILMGGGGVFERSMRLFEP